MAAAVFRAAALGLACAACTSVLVDARTFEDTGWRVIAIDGQPTPATGDYRIEFGKGQISGRFGCNGWGGRYAVTGDTIAATLVRSTLMGCPEPAASFESTGLAVLRQPMRVALTSGTKLTLSNAAGSIALQQVR